MMRVGTRSSSAVSSIDADVYLELETLGAPLPPSSREKPLVVVLAAHLLTRARAEQVLSTWAAPRTLSLRLNGSLVGKLRIEPIYFGSSPELRGLSLPSSASVWTPPGSDQATRTDSALRHAAAMFPGALWFFKGDDDALLHVGRLLRSLLARNFSAPLLVGHIAPPEWASKRFVSGGAGYALSRAALEALVPRLASCSKERIEDIKVSFCIGDLFGEGAIVDEPGLNFETPERQLAEGHYHARHVAAAPISHHHIAPDRFAAMVEAHFPRTLTQVTPFRLSLPGPWWALGWGGVDAAGQLEKACPGLPSPEQVANAETCARAAAAAGFQYALIVSANYNCSRSNKSDDRSSDGALAEATAAVLHELYLRGGVVATLDERCSDANEVANLLDVAAAAGASAETAYLTLDDPRSWAFGSTRHGASSTLLRRRRLPRAWAASQFNHDVFRLGAAFTLQGADLLRQYGGLAAAVAAAHDSLRVDVTPAPLRVYARGMWAGTRAVMDELWLLSDVSERAVGRALVPTDSAEGADVILFGHHDHADALSVVRRFAATAISVFIGYENLEGGAFDNMMVGDVDVSFGYRREKPQPSDGSTAATAYVRLPWWLPYTVTRERGGCALPQALYAPSNPNVWAQRMSFTALLSSHYAYPRAELFDLLSTLGRVDAPGKAFHNTEWPPDLPNSHLRGKLDYLRRFRFTICPENSRTRGAGGYSTEKLAQAHLAGAVPIYWGDPVDVQVFNPARVLVFNGSNGADIVEAVRRLESDEGFRRRWFSEPVLSPTADSWIEGWCAAAAAALRGALARL